MAYLPDARGHDKELLVHEPRPQGAAARGLAAKASVVFAAEAAKPADEPRQRG